MPNPITNSTLYDQFTLAGKVSPGLCKISGASMPRKWDERKSTGNSGATLVYSGGELAKFSITLTFYLEEHWAQWEQFRVLLTKPKPGVTPSGLDIYHPFLAELDIRSVVVEDFTQPNEVDGGVFAVEIKFIQFENPKPTGGKPTSASAMNVYEGKTGLSDDPIDTMIGGLADEAANLEAETS